MTFHEIFLQILLTVAEHHSAIVPWQVVAQKTGATLQYVTLTEDEVPDAGKLLELLTRKTKLVVVHHVSNVLGRYSYVLDNPFLTNNRNGIYHTYISTLMVYPIKIVTKEKKRNGFPIEIIEMYCFKFPEY